MKLPEQEHLLFALGTASIAEHTCTIRGLKFYMPRSTMGKPKTAIDFYEGCQRELTDSGRDVITE